MTAMHKIDIQTGFIGPTLLLRKGTKKKKKKTLIFLSWKGVKSRREEKKRD